MIIARESSSPLFNQPIRKGVDVICKEFLVPDLKHRNIKDNISIKVIEFESSKQFFVISGD